MAKIRLATIVGPGVAGASGTGTVSASTKAFDYPGIPYVTDAVPSAIMPTEPTGADLNNHEWVSTYDPILEPAPDHATIAPNWPSAEQANCYYVDAFHGSATDTANTYGYPDKPRATIPTGLWGSSTLYAEIHGNNTAYSSTPDYDLGAGKITVNLAGTSSNPVFIKGVDAPRIGNGGGGSDNIDCVGITHVIFDGLTIQDRPGGNRPWPQFSINSGSEYVCFRNGIIRGDNSGSSGGQLIPMAGDRTNGETRFICFYNTQISDGGDHITNTQERDVHGWRPSYLCRYLWLVNCELTRLQADGVQCGNSANTIPAEESSNQDYRSHYIYIAGNDFHDLFENAVDNKNSFHVITSSNTMRELYSTGTGGGANNTAYILSNNSEGDHSGYHWSLFDHVYNCGNGIRDSGNTANEKNYVIGALVENTNTYSFRKENNGTNVECYIIDSTVYNIGGDVFSDSQPGNNSITELHGILAHTITNGLDNGPDPDTTNLVNFRYWNMGGGINAAWDQTNVAEASSDPLVDPANDNFTPQGDALAQNTKHPAYDKFQAMYGLNIYIDRDGNARDATTPDVGAVEA